MQNRKHKKRDYELETLPFEMIIAIAKTMNELEKIVIDYDSASDKSE